MLSNILYGLNKSISLSFVIRSAYLPSVGKYLTEKTVFTLIVPGVRRTSLRLSLTIFFLQIVSNHLNYQKKHFEVAYDPIPCR